MKTLKKPRFTDQQLTDMDQQQLHQLYLNASRYGALDLVDQIEGLGVAYGSPKGIKPTSALGRALTRIIQSEAGRAAALGATENGRPALEPIDLLLQAELGEQYRRSYDATIQAAHIVMALMQEMGYAKTGSKALAPACHARSGQLFASR